ncbi:MAG: HAMP domain-containing sensor histidine kinase [Vicinamibacterales bacterium]
MKTSGSFRARVIFGFLVWTVGVMLLVHVGSSFAIGRLANHLFIAHSAVLAWFAGLLLVIGFAQVRRGLVPFQLLRDRLADVRDGRARHLEGGYPAEVQPLVSDLNALLDQREQDVRRAQSRAGDLAHGLKTPLAVLAREAERAEAAGQHALAATIAEQVDRMRRQVDVHLAQARATAPGAAPGGRCDVAASVAGLSRALARLHTDRGVRVESRVPEGFTVRGRREDVDEMLGNLLDNACSWARSRVTVDAASDGATATITIDDDGPGLEPSMRERVLQRGVRGDDPAAGSGLGLAIVRDLASLYGGDVALDAAPGGGLRARLRLPA